MYCNYYRLEDTCLTATVINTNYPADIDTMVQNFYPGQVYDADDQCYIAGLGNTACASVCTLIFISLGKELITDLTNVRNCKAILGYN